LGDVGRFEVPIPRAWIEDWLASADSGWTGAPARDLSHSDSGLTIKIAPSPAMNDRLIRCRSRSAVEAADSIRLRPRLYLPVLVQDSADGVRPDSLAVTAAADMFILAYDSLMNRVNRDTLFVGSGVVWRSLLRFDVSAIWPALEDSVMVVNQAMVTLYRTPRDDLWPVTKSAWPRKLTNEVWLTDPFSMEEATITGVATPVVETGDSLQLLVTRAAAEWFKGAAWNFGVSVHSVVEQLDIDRVGFYSQHSGDAARKPRLTVHYTRLAR
jgi:hypothetical protein